VASRQNQVSTLSGSTSPFERVGDALAAMGEPHHVGDAIGLGQVAKLVNQIMMSVAMIGTLEGAALARAYNIDVEALLPILTTGTASSWAVHDFDHIEQIGNTRATPWTSSSKDLGEVMAVAST
jgi:3-hydroxyisobutyrate dehydrogenase